MTIGIFKYDGSKYGTIECNGEKYKLEKLTTYHDQDIVDYNPNTNSVELVSRVKKSIPGLLNCKGPVMGIVKPGVVLRRFIPATANYPEILVPSRKVQADQDEYGSIEITSVDGDRLRGLYLSKIGYPGKIADEQAYLAACYNANWKKSKVKADYGEDLTPDRVDMTHDKAWAIDPDGCVDVDDAIGFKRTETGFTLYVHIADVTSYIPENSEMDIIGRERVESLYLSWKQANMYPDDLVKAMSLYEGRKNRAFTVEITFVDFKITDINCYKTLVTPTNTTYDTVMEDNEIQPLYEFCKSLYESGEVIQKTTEFDTHKLVEICMISANVAVAKKLDELGQMLICREHKKATFVPKMDIDENVLEKIQFYNSMKAKYVFGRSAHETIGQELYTHFTSPIRRYIDVVIHRLLFDSLCGSAKCANYIDHAFLTRINVIHEQIQKANRKSHILSTLYDLYIQNKLSSYVTGRVVGIGQNFVRVAIDDYDIDIKCQVFPFEIKDRVDGFVSTTTDETITIEHAGKTVMYTLGDKVELNMIIMFLEPKLDKKVVGELIPNPLQTISLFINEKH